MTSIRLNPLDAAWIMTETRATPNHVGGLLIFKLPEGAPRDFLRRLMHDFRTYRGFTAPWNRRLKTGFNLNPMPEWIEDHDIDLEYHVRHAALPWPGGERELGELVGRLQSTPMDLSRPPWECTIIEGLEHGRFALFVKMHHSLIDGISGMRMLQQAMSTDPAKSLALPPFWSADDGQPGAGPAPRRCTDHGQRHGLGGAGAARAAEVGAAAAGRLRQDLPPRRRRRRGHGGALRCAAVGAERPRAREAPLRHAAVPDGAAARAGRRRRLHAQRRGAGAVRRLAAPLPARARQPAGQVADRRHPGVGAAQGRPGHRQCHQLHHLHAGHRHRGRGRAPGRDPRVGAPCQGACAEPAAPGDDAVHRAADGADHRHAAQRHRRAHAADVQHHHLQRARARTSRCTSAAHGWRPSTRPRSSPTARR